MQWFRIFRPSKRNEWSKSERKQRRSYWTEKYPRILVNRGRGLWLLNLARNTSKRCVQCIAVTGNQPSQHKLYRSFLFTVSEVCWRRENQKDSLPTRYGSTLSWIHWRGVREEWRVRVGQGEVVRRSIGWRLGEDCFLQDNCNYSVFYLDCLPKITNVTYNTNLLHFLQRKMYTHGLFRLIYIRYIHLSLIEKHVPSYSVLVVMTPLPSPALDFLFFSLAGSPSHPGQQ